jgi:two-component system chemotaxis response regulator CheB
LLQVLKQLPASLPCGVVIVQHISEGFDAGLAEWLNDQCDIDVRLGTDNAPLTPGVVHIAPSGSHMTITPAGRLKLSNEEPVDCQKPSATVLFHSVAAVYRDRAVCVILTGMGADGVDGLKSVKAAGGKIVAQDQSTCVVFGMPKAAIEVGVVDWICPIGQIAPAILRALRLPQPKEAVR